MLLSIFEDGLICFWAADSQHKYKKCINIPHQRLKLWIAPFEHLVTKDLH